MAYNTISFLKQLEYFMGYRSEVAITIYDANVGKSSKIELLKEYYLTTITLDIELANILKIHFNNSKCNTAGRDVFEEDILFHVDDTKWYEGSMVVDFFDKLTKMAIDLGLNVESMIIGEDLDDVTSFKSGEALPYRIGFNRSISIY
jgi:hypothetical protein